jgi:PQQ-like domain
MNPGALVGPLLVGGFVGLMALLAGWRVLRLRPPPPPTLPSTGELATATPSAPDTRAAEPACERLRALPGLVLVGQNHDADALLLVVEPVTTANKLRRLTARDPASGRELWSRPLEFEGPVEQILSIPIAEKLVVAMPNRVWGLDPETGQMSWERATTSAPERACARGRDFGLIDAKLGFSAFSAVTGAPTALARAACEPIYDSRSDAPNFAFADAATAIRWLPENDDFVVTRGLLPQRGAAEVVLGIQKNEAGAGSASVGVVSSRRWLWQANVANEAPSSAEFTTPPLAAVRERRVVVPYVSGQHVALTGLELTSGERLWTTVLPEASDSRSNAPVAEGSQSELAVARGGHVAYRTAKGELTVLNLDTGAIEWTLACKE